MRVYKLALAIFIFNYILSFVSGCGIVPLEISPGDGQFGESEIKDNLQEIEAIVNQSDTGVMGEINELVVSVKFLISSLPLVFSSLFYATVGVPVLLYSLNAPTLLVALITPIVYFVFLYGLFEILTGRAFED